MDANSISIAEWETFYLLAGTAAATLIGLLSIALSIQIEEFRQKTSAELQLFAALTFNCFFYVLLISMLFLIPGISPFWLGLSLLIFGVLAIGGSVLQRHQAEDRRTKSRFHLPLVGMILLVVFSVLLMTRMMAILYGFVLIDLIFLTSASRNAWELLVRPEH